MKTRPDQQRVSKSTKRSVYDEDTFRHFLALDKNRTERSGRPFLLLLVDVGKLSGSRDGFEAFFEALRRSLRETDYVGWYQASQVAGARSGSVWRSRLRDRVYDGSQAGCGRCRSAVSGNREVVELSGPSTGTESADWSHPVALTFGSFQRRPISAQERLEDRVRPTIVIGPSLFESALSRERQRADRFNHSLVLVESRLVNGVAPEPECWERIVSSVCAATRSADVVGWIEFRSALGVIFTESRVVDGKLAGGIEQRVQRELRRRVDKTIAENFLFQVRVYPDPDQDRVSVPSLCPLLPLLDDIRSRDTQGRVYEIVRRGIDIVGSVALLAALSPLLLTIAAAIKLRSPGPVLFRQTRIGYRGRPFTMFKFRTMRTDADHGIHQAFVSDFINDSVADGNGERAKTFKIVEDPRVTRLGRLLRKTSLDELPQLWNVLWGEMSLVGPRPPIPYEVEQYRSWHRRRVLEAKPGLTGLWQVTGRSETTFDEMVTGRGASGLDKSRAGGRPAGRADVTRSGVR